MVGLALTLGAVAGIGINTAHELGHEKESSERWLARVALAQCFYGHFHIEHNRGHHVRVATPDDPASSRMEAERDDWIRQRNAARLATVTSLLSSRTSDGGDALGYDLDGPHVGAVLWCGTDVDEADRLQRTVPQVAATLGCALRPLVVAPDASTLWVWFPSTTAPVPAVTGALARGTWAALGDPAHGPAGFRRTHQQAQQARTIATAADPAHRLRVTAPALLGPLALLAVDPGSAAPWVQSVLGELADDDGPRPADPVAADGAIVAPWT